MVNPSLLEVDNVLLQPHTGTGTRTGRWVFFGRPFIQKVRIAVRSVHAFAHRHASRSLAWRVHAGGDESVCWQRV